MRHTLVEVFRASYYQSHTSQYPPSVLQSDQLRQNNKVTQLLLEFSSSHGPLNKPLKNDPNVDQHVTADHFSTTFLSKFNVELLAGLILNVEK